MTQPNSVSITCPSSFLACVQRGGVNGSLYRGQANADWPVDCSAARRLNASLSVKPALLGHALMGYLSTLLVDTRRFVGTHPDLPPGSSDLDILAQLQHHGAATGLIDFTLDPLVVLWFACSDFDADDGAVYVLSRSDTREIDETDVQLSGALQYFRNVDIRDEDAPPYRWTPRKARRPAAQQSVFVLGVPFVLPCFLRKIMIGRDVKPTILDELETAHGITEGSLFNDLTGHARANASSRNVGVDAVAGTLADRVAWQESNGGKVQAHLDCALAYAAVGNHAEAADHCTAAIAIDPENAGAYTNRAGAFVAMGDHAKALEDYDAAIKNLKLEGENSGEEWLRQQAARVYWDRGSVRQRVGLKTQGIADQNRAIELGLKMWIDISTGEIAANPVREELHKYKDTLK